MRLRRDELSYHLAIRRVALGAKPFRWEVHGTDTVTPLRHSAELFSSMEAAYSAGQGGLQEFLLGRRAEAGRE